MSQHVSTTRSGLFARVVSLMTSQAFSGLLVVGALVGGYLVLHHFENGGHAATTEEDAHSEDNEGAEPLKSSVELSEQQMNNSGIQVIELEEKRLEPARTVPGRIDYNSSRLLELKAPMAAVARRVFVQSGQHVEAGTPLAILDGPEVGVARAELAKLNAEYALRAREYQNAKDIAKNLDLLVESLRQRADMRTIETEFDQQFLGEHREKLISAYSRFLLAENLSDSVKPLAEKGVSSTRLLQERQSAREVAFAEFRGLSQQSTIESHLAMDRAQGEMEFARRMVRVGEQKLAALAGNFSTELDSGAESALTELELRAPFRGTIQSRELVEAERIVPNETLFVLADTTRLWVVMEIRENLWSALQSEKGTVVHVTTAALPGQVFDAEVEFTGGSVSALTRSVPLVASLPNPDGLLKPGMLAWVSVPTGPASTHLAVPPSAIVQHQDIAFVFVEEKPGSFRRVDVVPGLETEKWTAVTGNLKAGDRVVSEGAFILKSELLLEAEEE